MDGELDLVRRMEIERHIQTCPECADHVNNGRAVQIVLRSDRLYYGAPAGFEGRVLTAVRAAERAQTPRSRVFLRPAFGIAAFAALLSLLWIVFAQVQRTNREAAVIHQVTCSHVHSLMANHLLDIASTDALAVRTWYTGKLDYAPTVFDLTRQGYPMMGGRLDYVNDNTVAALVYTRKKHVINLFLWPAAERDSQTLRQEGRSGYQICRWTGGGMTYCAVSDLSPQELALFAGTIQTHITPIEIDNCKSSN
ncbi:MAG: putative anti-sigma factor [Chthonomonadaceae bacterium]|nr:putative anti-sigma factor [Chthonomonadaceae bacterium]